MEILLKQENLKLVFDLFSNTNNDNDLIYLIEKIIECDMIKMKLVKYFSNLENEEHLILFIGRIMRYPYKDSLVKHVAIMDLLENLIFNSESADGEKIYFKNIFLRNMLLLIIMIIFIDDNIKGKKYQEKLLKVFENFEKIADDKLILMERLNLSFFLAHYYKRTQDYQKSLDHFKLCNSIENEAIIKELEALVQKQNIENGSSKVFNILDLESQDDNDKSGLEKINISPIYFQKKNPEA